MRTSRKAHIGEALEGSLIADQLRLEQDSVTDGVNRYREMAQVAMKRGERPSLKPVERFMLHWYLPLREEIKMDQTRIRRGSEKITSATGYYIWGPVMLMLKAERIAVCAMHQALDVCLTDPLGVKFAHVAYSIGRSVVAEIQLDTLKKSDKEAYDEMDRRLRAINPCTVNWYCNRTLDDPIWNRKVCAHLGVRLFWHLIHTASIRDYEKPFERAFIPEYRREQKRTVRYIRCSDELLDIIDEGTAAREMLHPRYQPMLVPPLPQSSTHEGGYLRLRAPLVSKLTRGQKALIEKANMPEVYAGFNALQSTAWRINEEVLDAQISAWNAGGGVLGVPPVHNLPMPEKLKVGDQKAINANAHERAEVWEMNRQMKGERKMFNMLVGDAARFRKRRIHIPHFMCFRSRCYARPTVLNHQRGDMVRALFEFADPRPMSDRAMWWLKVHAANCYGIDKVPFDDRVQWTDNNASMIQLCAEKPEATTFWHDADKGDAPWQFLAACNALIYPNCGARLPVQADGTCNGLQHYAAMGRDEAGAVAVNLLPCSFPNRVYSDVARETEKLVLDDAANSTAWLQFKKRDGTILRYEIKEIAARLCGNITDDTVKHPVMTAVYGVTYVGARQQVYESLTKAGYDSESKYRTSMYLSRLVIDSMDSVVPVARSIMVWLGKLARIVSIKLRKPLVWRTPLGFPVQQPYRQLKKFTIRTIMQDLRLAVTDDNLPVLPSRQIDGFAPNFVHSIDATHMLMVANECKKRGIAFAAVHDSFWSHAEDMDELRQIVLEKFVELHRVDLLDDLVGQLREQHPGVEFPDPPPRGNLDINRCLNATYAFS